MGNKPVKQEHEEIIMVKVMPPLDQAYMKWLARDLERLHGFTLKKPRSIKPPDHYIEYMRLYGWLDLDMDDPDLARLLNAHEVMEVWKESYRKGVPASCTYKLGRVQTPEQGLLLQTHISHVPEATAESVF